MKEGKDDISKECSDCDGGGYCPQPPFLPTSGQKEISDFLLLGSLAGADSSLHLHANNMGSKFYVRDRVSVSAQPRQ